jgi:DNA-binding NtrC family response regulator
MQKANRKRQTKVLLVDCDLNLLRVSRECLRLQGDIDVETALSSDEALEKLKKLKPDVIISDIQLPGTDDFAFLKTLRDKGVTTPFIVFSMNNTMEMDLKAHHFGANGFIAKYGDPSIVYSLLKKCILSLTKNSVNVSGALEDNFIE